MKNVKYCGLLLFSILLIIQITSCGGGGDDSPGISYTPGTPFITSDLAGTWYIFATNGDSIPAGNIVAGNLRGTLNIDQSGYVTGGAYTRSNGGTASFLGGQQGGLLTIDNAGVISGSTATNLGVNFYIVSGKMNVAKDFISFVSNTNNGEFNLFTAMRAGGTFASSDLADTWYLFSASGDYAKMTLSDVLNSTAIVASPGGGFFNIDGNGSLRGTGFVTETISNTALFLTSSTSTTTTPNGKINLNKDMMSFASSTTAGKFDLVTGMRAGGTFALSDLAGTWFISGTSSSTSVGNVTNEPTFSGTIILNSSGLVTGGSYTRPGSNGGTDTFTGGALTIDNNGVLGGNATTGLGDNITILSGKMHLSKSVMSLVGNTSHSEQDLLIFIKGS